ncbi:MAG: CHAD domain-containing protein [Candidatus Korobacteraceae bacterium]
MAKTAAPKPAERGISYWMERVVAEREKARKTLNASVVHDLRVALRHCRSMAEGFQNLNGDPSWGKMRKAGKVVFSALGGLRDTQVLLEWIERLRSDCPAVAERLESDCLQREAILKTTAAEVVGKFDVQRWQQWAEKLDKLVQGVENSAEVFQALALERYEAAHKLHAKALRDRSKTALHALRIGIKKFRYILENFLPDLEQAWGNDLRHVQDLLGEVHDLDVLWNTACQIQAFASPQERQQWFAAVSRERTQRVQAYREKMVGRHSWWQEWRSGLPAGEQLHRAVLKRFETWAASLDPDPAHTQLVTKFSLELYDALQVAELVPARGAGAVSPRDLLQVAALTHGAGHGGRDKARHKLCGRLLEKLEIPPGWSATDLTIAALVARYHRGALPTTRKRYAALSFADQHLADSLGGILRFADSLDSRHDRAIRAIAVSRTVGRTDIVAEGYVPRSKQAEKIAAARHVLEDVFQTALLVHGSTQHSAATDRRSAAGSAT